MTDLNRCARCNQAWVYRIKESHGYRWCPTCKRIPYTKSEYVPCHRCGAGVTLNAGICTNCGAYQGE